MFTDALRDPRSEIVRLTLLVSARSSFLEFVRSLVEAMRFLMDEFIVLFDLDSWPLNYHSVGVAAMVAEWWWHGVWLEFREESFLLSNLSTLKFLRFMYIPGTALMSQEYDALCFCGLGFSMYILGFCETSHHDHHVSLLSSWPSKIQVAQKARYFLYMIAWFARYSYPEFSPKPWDNLNA